MDLSAFHLLMGGGPSPEKILIVDDETDARDIQQLLKSRTQSSHFIVSDMSMPRMDDIFGMTAISTCCTPTCIVVPPAYALFPGLKPNIFMAGNRERLEAS
jgi:hypothetical protein